MPGTPPLTSPDNLPRIGDTDSPDIPRDMNALADAVQAALLAREAAAAAALSGQAVAWFVSTAVANNVVSNLPFNPTSFTASNVALTATNQRLSIQRAGWWSFTAYVDADRALAGRSFVEAVVATSAGVVANQTRYSINPGEDLAACSGTLFFPQPNYQLWFQVLHTTGLTVNFTGTCVVKYLGPAA